MVVQPADRLAGWPARALAFGLGLVAATGHAPLFWWPLALPALGLLLRLGAMAPGGRAAAWLGWAGAFGHFAGAMFWIVEPFFVDPLRHGWMAPFALVLLPGGLALFWAAAFGLARWWRGGVWLMACLLATAELVRAHVFTGFPWAAPGQVWIDSPLGQMAAVIGPHGLTLAALLAAAAIGSAGRGRAGIARPLGAVVALAGLWVWGAARLDAPTPPAPGTVVRVVQPNAEQSLKWDAALAAEFMRRLLTETAAAPQGPAPDVTIWPETAVPYVLNGAEALLADIDRAAGGRPVVLGIVRRDDADIRVFNSLIVTGPGGTPTAIYDKHHLTPFGEYVPFGDLLARFGIHGMAASEGRAFTPGPGPQVLDIPGAGTALPLICYEAIFPALARTHRRAGWIVNITNDAWFGQMSGPWQHLAQARLRAIEQGLPVIRSANTGISAVIDARGRVVGHLPLGVQGHIDAPLPAALPPTPYARTGDSPALLALFVLVLGFGVAARRNRH